MDTSVETLKDLFKIGYEAYEDSRIEALHVWDLYHNRQWTQEHENILENRGQPKETFNIIKLFSRMMLGYYSTVVNDIHVSATQVQDIPVATLLNDVVKSISRKNSSVTEGDKIKLGGLISGLFISEVGIENTGKVDRFGRPYRRCVFEYVPDSEVVLDPLSRKDDYSDANHIHRFKWLREEDVIELYGRAKFDELYEYFNHLNIDEAEFEYSYNGQFTGHYRVFNNYLIVNSIIIDDKGKTWSVHWCDETELFRTEVTDSLVKFPYRVQKLHTSNRTEHYGVFREVAESQLAINQAIIKIQLLANTTKIFVEQNAVEDIDEFSDAVNRVNSVVEVLDLNGIKVEQMSKEIADLYVIIDRAFDRIQRILGINDSFLGMAFASDSGRKVKLQQNASIMSLRYLTARIEQFYTSLGWDIVNLIKQYYTAEQVVRIADEVTGERWLTLNKPMEIFTGSFDPNGQPVMEMVFEEVTDPVTGEPILDEAGNLLFAPIPEGETEVKFTDVDIEINSVAYNDEDEKNQLMIETILSGNTGSMLAQINPAGYFKAVGLSLRTMKTKYSPEISQILLETAQQLGAVPGANAEAATALQGGNSAGSPPKSNMSSQLKLPQNTNEGA